MAGFHRKRERSARHCCGRSGEGEEESENETDGLEREEEGRSVVVGAGEENSNCDSVSAA